MSKTGVEDLYILKGNKKLRCGYTTGSCAAGASKAAATMLLSGRKVSEISLLTPNGIRLNLPIEDICATQDRKSVSCAVRKDCGDDPDVTGGILVYAKVSIIEDYRCDEHPHAFVSRGRSIIILDGGIGIGRVTRAGLKQNIGEAAINPVPRRMIIGAVESVCGEHEFTGTLLVTIYIPEGEEVAGRTFNPRLGIKGGISILGTTGIVKPMSDEALIASIRLEMSMLVKSGHNYLLITPGNYGSTYIQQSMDIDLSLSMMCSNFVGETLDEAVNLGVNGVLFVAHIGKFIKVAGGIMNTHSRCSDCRAELCASFALRAGACRDDAMRILDTQTTDEAIDIMTHAGVRDKAMALACDRIRYYMQHRTGGVLRTEAIIFNTTYGLLGMTEGADELVSLIGAHSSQC